jgi:hypothetical protein
MRSAYLTAIIGSFSLLSDLHAEQPELLDREVSIDWVVIDSAGTLSNLAITQTTPIVIASITPAKTFELQREIIGLGAQDRIPAGTRFAPVSTNQNTYCEIERRPKMGSIRCLMDIDGDGTFDHVAKSAQTDYRYQATTNYGYTIGAFYTSSWEAMSIPVSKTMFEMVKKPEPIKIRLHGSIDRMLGTRILLNVCVRREEGRSLFGFKNVADYCYGREYLSPNELPQTVSIGGLSITVNAIDTQTKTAIISAESYRIGDIL